MDDGRRRDRSTPGPPREPPRRAHPGWSVTEIDLVADTVPAEVGGPGRRSTLRQRGSWTRRFTAAAVSIAVVGVLVTTLLAPTERDDPDATLLPRPRPTVAIGADDPGSATVAAATVPVTESDLGVVADSGARLVLLDRRGARFVDGRDGSVSEPVPAAASVAPPIGSAEAVVQVDAGVDELVAISPAGRRTIATGVGGQVVGVTRARIWVADLDGAGGSVLSAHLVSSGRVVEEIVLDRGDSLVGFHRGRPIVEHDGMIRVHDASGIRDLVAGRVIAHAGRHLLFHSCPEGSSCDDPVMLLDLETAAIVEIDLDVGVRAFGDRGRALSPDGRWLVGLDLADRSTPIISVFELRPRDRVGPGAAPLPLAAGTLGFGGRSTRFAWSPGGDLLVAPGSSRVTLVDPERRVVTSLPVQLAGDGPGLAWIDEGVDP